MTRIQSLSGIELPIIQGPEARGVDAVIAPVHRPAGAQHRQPAGPQARPDQRGAARVSARDGRDRAAAERAGSGDFSPL